MMGPKPTLCGSTWPFPSRAPYISTTPHSLSPSVCCFLVFAHAGTLTPISTHHVFYIVFHNETRYFSVKYSGISCSYQGLTDLFGCLSSCVFLYWTQGRQNSTFDLFDSLALVIYCLNKSYHILGYLPYQILGYLSYTTLNKYWMYKGMKSRSLVSQAGERGLPICPGFCLTRRLYIYPLFHDKPFWLEDSPITLAFYYPYADGLSTVNSVTHLL